MAVALRSSNSGGPFGTVFPAGPSVRWGPSVSSGTVCQWDRPLAQRGAARQPSQSTALVLDGLGGRQRRLRVQVAPAWCNGAERRIKLVQQRDAGGDVELGNRRIA